jgi:hypothetical protein
VVGFLAFIENLVLTRKPWKKSYARQLRLCPPKTRRQPHTSKPEKAALGKAML